MFLLIYFDVDLVCIKQAECIRKVSFCFKHWSLYKNITEKNIWNWLDKLFVNVCIIKVLCALLSNIKFGKIMGIWEWLHDDVYSTCGALRICKINFIFIKSVFFMNGCHMKVVRVCMYLFTFWCCFFYYILQHWWYSKMWYNILLQYNIWNLVNVKCHSMNIFINDGNSYAMYKLTTLWMSAKKRSFAL